MILNNTYTNLYLNTGRLKVTELNTLQLVGLQGRVADILTFRKAKSQRRENRKYEVGHVFVL